MYALEDNGGANPQEAQPLPHLDVDVAATALLYERCSRCMYLHTHGDTGVPLGDSDPATGPVRALMASAQESQHWIELTVGPRFRVCSQQELVVSAPVEFQLAHVSYSGVYDAIVEHSDGRMILVKYVFPSDAAADTSRQQRELAALNFALEHPSDPGRKPARIDGHALLGFAARQIMERAHVETQYVPLRWTELERRPDRFLSFMRVVTCILALGHEPPPAPGCPNCRRRRRDTVPTPAGHPGVTPLRQS